MVCLFWNVNRHDRAAVLAELCVEHDVQLLMLAECGRGPADLVATLNATGIPGFTFYPGFAGPQIGRPMLFLRHPTATLVSVRDDASNRVTVRRVAGMSSEWLLVVAHLPSKLHVAASNDRTQLMTRLGRLIRDEEASARHRRTVVVGDLNMNPFEPGVVGSEGLHGVMTRAIAATGGRQVGRQHREYFYNPMWQFLGERAAGPPGTYSSRAGGFTTYFWHVLDQVLVRPDLMNHLSDVRIVHRVGPKSLLSAAGLPDAAVGSDHLPLRFTLDL